MKRIALILLVMLLCMSIIPAMAAVEILPAVEGQTNVILNGDMEPKEGEVGLDGWTPTTNPWGENPKVMLDTGNIHGGKYAMKIGGAGTPWARQLVPVQGGARYQMTGWVYAPKVEDIPAVKFEGYNMDRIDREFATTNANFLFTRSEQLTIGEGKLEGGKWQPFSIIYEPDQNTKFVAIYLRYYGADLESFIWFDDVEMHMIEGPAKIELNLNSNNYYATETEGTLIISVNQNVYSDFADWSVACRILDGETEIWNEKASLKDGEATLKFDISGLAARDEDYSVEAVLFEGEKESEKRSASFGRRFERPKTLTEDGLYYDENGEIFHPIISYHLYKESALQECIDMGMNVIQMAYGYVAPERHEEALKILDSLHAKGLKAFVALNYLDHPAGHPDIREEVTAYVNKIKGHPAIWAYSIHDEPVGGNCPEPLVVDSYELVRELDPTKPVYCIDQREWMYPQLIRNVDVLGIDNYPYGKYNAMEYIYSSTKYAVELASLSGKPVYPVLQFFPRGEGEFTKNPGELYFPEPGAMRNMIYQVLMAGAKGYGLFAFDFSYRVNDVWVARTPTADALRAFNAKEKDMMFDYFIENKYPTFTNNFNDNPDYRWVSFVKDNEIYLAVVNRHEFKETEAAIPLTSDNGLLQVGSFTAEGYAGEAEDATGLKTLYVTLQPGDVAVYKIKPSNKMDFTLLEEKATPLTDIDAYDWAKEQIEALYEKGIVNIPEEGKFLPGENITRGDFAYFLVRTLGLTNEAGEQFADVPADSYYAKEIAIGRAAGILNGVGENAYAPTATITRQDMMTLISRGLALAKEADLSAFSDSNLIADYALSHVSAMIAEGLIKGNADGTLNPLGNTTRAEAAVIMDRILKR